MQNGYMLKFNLYARHAIVIDGQSSPAHAHTWNVSISITTSDEFYTFNRTEHLIKSILDRYQDQALNEIPPFDKINPTLENIGDFLFQELQERLRRHHIQVDRLEISETPVRVYVARNPEEQEQDRNSLPINLYLKGLIANTTQALMKEALGKEPPREALPPSEADIPQAAKKHHTPKTHHRDAHTQHPKTQAAQTFQSTLKWWHHGVSALSVSTKMILALAAICLSALFLIVWVNRTGTYPWGYDALGHIFKGDLLYQNIKEGNFYPLYTDMWYNGIQPYRYWAPVPYYILAAFQFLTGGDPISGYQLFTVFCFIVGALGWLLWGIREKRIFWATFFGILWFCMPDNIRVFYLEGNVPRITIAFLLPYMFYFIWHFMEYRKKWAIIPVILLMSLICMNHLMIAAMLGITTFFFLLYYGIINHRLGEPVEVLIGMVLGIILTGVWLYPALQGGLMSIDQGAVSDVMRSLTFPFTQSLNPFLRLKNFEPWYFGLSFFLIALVGLFLANKKSRASFLTLLTVFLGTTTALVPFLIKLPMNQLLWMMRFTPIAYAIFTIGVLAWKELKRVVLILFAVMLAADSAISFYVLAYNVQPNAEEVRMYDETAQATSQRTALIDLSQFNSWPSYWLCTGENAVKYAYGWAWQGAGTAQNIMLINSSFEKERYAYLFDRCIEMGCDTVLVKKDRVKDFDKLHEGATLSSFQLLSEYENGYLYKLADAPEHFGIKTTYYGLAVGSSSTEIILEFPGFQIATESKIDHYTLEELCKYEILYLSGFEYDSKSAAETLLREAADRGVKIVLDMNRVPYDPFTNRLTFLDVTAQPIQFESKLPDLHVTGQVYFPTTFKEEFRNWNTVYLEDVPNPLGFSWFGGNKLTFIGQDTTRNITYVGFNLLYHGIVNEDSNVIDIFATVMGKMANALPKRELVPIDIQVDQNEITIHSDGDKVNTTLAYLDAFETEQKTETIHDLLVVDEPEVKIQVTYPYFKQGTIVSLSGLLGTGIFLWSVFRRRNKKGRNRGEEPS